MVLVRWGAYTRAASSEFPVASSERPYASHTDSSVGLRLSNWRASRRTPPLAAAHIIATRARRASRGKRKHA